MSATHVLLFLCTAAGFGWGAVRHFKKGTAIFLQIVTCSLGSAALGYLFFVAKGFLDGDAGGFHVGYLGLIGSYFFLFSASFGQIDGLGDSRAPELRKYRLRAMLAPAVIVASFLPMLTLAEGSGLWVNALLFLLFAATGYYNLKHLLLPDVADGILTSIRRYNAAMLLITLLNMLLAYAELLSLPGWVQLVPAVPAGLALMLLPYIADQGVQKWYL